METLARDLALAALFYLVPGNAILLIADVPGLTGARRQFLALCISLVAVPYALQIAGSIHTLRPGPGPLAALSAGACLVAWLLKRLGRRPIIASRPAGVDHRSPGRFEEAAAWVAIAAFATVALLPRLHMFLYGSATPLVAPWDETWHLAQLTSVARTGIPPRHYFFPQLHLAYYYASWILPASLGNIPGVTLSLSRALAIHATLQVFAFLGLLWLYLRSALSDWRVRWLGLAFFTFAGGFDYFFSLPSVDAVDWWQRSAAWLASDLQVSQFVTLYLWVPQHLAGGMAFVAAWLLWKNVKASPQVKSALTGVLLAFCLATSPYVFLGFALATCVFAFASRKAIASNPSTSAVCLVILSLCFFLAAWGVASLYRGYPTSLEWSRIHLVILERFREGVPAAFWGDRVITLVGFPLVASALLLIEMGLAFLLYLAWWASRARRRPLLRDPFEFTVALLPPLSMLALFVVWSSSGGGNLGMRGLIPAQILIVFGGLALLDEFILVARPTRMASAVMAYLAACFLAAQSISAIAEVRASSADSLRLVLANLRDVPAYVWPVHLEYMRWIDTNVPTDALIIEEGCPSSDDDPRYRWLERRRILSVACARTLGLFERDRDFILPAEWDAFSSRYETERSALALYQASDPSKDDLSPVYLAVWQGAGKPMVYGDPLYEDPSVSIYPVK